MQPLCGGVAAATVDVFGDLNALMRRHRCSFCTLEKSMDKLKQCYLGLLKNSYVLKKDIFK